MIAICRDPRGFVQNECPRIVMPSPGSGGIKGLSAESQVFGEVEAGAVGGWHNVVLFPSDLCRSAVVNKSRDHMFRPLRFCQLALFGSSLVMAPW